MGKYPKYDFILPDPEDRKTCPFCNGNMRVLIEQDENYGVQKVEFETVWVCVRCAYKANFLPMIFVNRLLERPNG